jgi:hypothetical protein
MAIDVRTLSRTPLGVTGHTLTGEVSNSKTMVTGDLDITTYTASGEPLVASDFGLTNIDALFVEVLDVDGTVASTSQIFNANYDRTNELFLLWDGNAGVTVAGSNAQLRFIAFGDSAHGPALT